jgi:predicted dehydrogenase/threonine dehydrogenase-like Zn-dependent dehydrogenase
MKQLTQKLKNGKLSISDFPAPNERSNFITVQNIYSVISTGTEGKTVTDAKRGFLSKAINRKKEVIQTINTIKEQGIVQAVNIVNNKLNVYSGIGYSSAGKILQVNKSNVVFKIGDYVACGGISAPHAEIISVPEKLCVRVPMEIDLKQAAFTTIASIAIQGIRQADVTFGNNCAVIGMGLIGQLCLQILNAAGVKPIGLDIDDERIKLAKKAGNSNIFNMHDLGIKKVIENLTYGHGSDAIIITAESSSLEPVEFAGEIARKKAKIIIVGSVPTGFRRENFYKKELDLRMSCSYGPGRYDRNYEEKGIDYPIGYVRFTENRNMQTYIDLLEEGKLNIKPLITHEFNLQDAPKAYDMIIGKKELYCGIIIKYDKKIKFNKEFSSNYIAARPYEPNVGLIGAGNFAQNILLPRMRGLCNFISIATALGNESMYVAKKYGFGKCFNSGDDVIRDKNVNTIFILTRHDTHSEYVIKGINAGKNVYVEKPLAMSLEELEEIKRAYKKQGSRSRLMLGFNRRFSPFVREARALFPENMPKAIHMRVNAGDLPQDHWVNDPDVGGGRIIGEACHFIDLAMHLSGGRIESVFASAMSDPTGLRNTVTMNLEFENGSIANLSYFSNGSKRLSKEYIELFCGETAVVIDDFKRMTVHSNRGTERKKKQQDKGHAREMKEFLGSIRNGKPCPIPFEESYLSTKATLAVLESIRTGSRILLTQFG